METTTFLCQFILATSANIIAGIILCNLKDGKHPSISDTIKFKIQINFEIHWNLKSLAMIGIITLICSGILLL